MRENMMKEILSEYEAQREANRAEETRRLAYAAQADPAIGALVSERSRAFQNGARDALAHPGDSMRISQALTERIAALQAQLRRKLVAAGLDADFLQPVYQCTRCRDTGYVGEPLHERCDCFERKLRERVIGGDNGLNPAETFASFDASIFPDTPLGEHTADTQRGLMERVRAFCEGYAEQYPHNMRPNLLFVGMSGLGKTFLLNCIGNHVQARGIEVFKLTAYQLIERVRASIFDHDRDAMPPLLDVPLLLLDDLGVEPLYNNITVEQLFSLLNERSLGGRHTVLSTNLMPDELSRRYTERVCSRLFDKRTSTMVMFKGKDVRLL